MNAPNALPVDRRFGSRGTLHTAGEHIRTVFAVGDSMRGDFDHGDPVLVNTARREFDSDGVYCFRHSGVVQIKRLQALGDGIVRILSTNPAYPPIDAPLDQIEIGGRVIGAHTLREF